MRYIKGDLVKLAQQDYFDVIVHGCNCFCTMGAGVAKTIKQVFPEAYKADCQTRKGDRSKLGTYTSAECITKSGSNITVINAYTQFRYGRDKQHVNYKAVEKALRTVNMNNQHFRIGLPKIGCGLAGGDWTRVESIIDDVMNDCDVTIVEYQHRGF